jgi:ubiquitin-conjugating enzyme E2 G2
MIFLEPNEASPANVDAAKMFRDNREKFDDMAKRSVRKTLGL